MTTVNTLNTATVREFFSHADTVWRTSREVAAGVLECDPAFATQHDVDKTAKLLYALEVKGELEATRVGGRGKVYRAIPRPQPQPQPKLPINNSLDELLYALPYGAALAVQAIVLGEYALAVQHLQRTTSHGV